MLKMVDSLGTKTNQVQQVWPIMLISLAKQTSHYLQHTIAWSLSSFLLQVYCGNLAKCSVCMLEVLPSAILCENEHYRHVAFNLLTRVSKLIYLCIYFMND